MVTARADNGSVNFPGKDLEEEFIFYFRQHWIRLIGPMMRTMTATAAAIVAGVMLFGFIDLQDDLLRRSVLIGLSAIVLLAQMDLMIHLYRYFLYVIIVTDKKIHRIKKTLLVVDDHESIDLWVLQDIRKSQHGIFQNMLGFGSLILDAQNTTLRIHFVPHIARCHEELMGLKEQSRARMRMWQQEQTRPRASLPHSALSPAVS